MSTPRVERALALAPRRVGRPAAAQTRALHLLHRRRQSGRPASIRSALLSFIRVGTCSSLRLRSRLALMADTLRRVITLWTVFEIGAMRLWNPCIPSHGAVAHTVYTDRTPHAAGGTWSNTSELCTLCRISFIRKLSHLNRPPRFLRLPKESAISPANV